MILDHHEVLAVRQGDPVGPLCSDGDDLLKSTRGIETDNSGDCVMSTVMTVSPRR